MKYFLREKSMCMASKNSVIIFDCATLYLVTKMVTNKLMNKLYISNTFIDVIIDIL